MAWAFGILVTVLIALILVFFIVMPPSKGTVPEFVDGNGSPMTESLAEKIKVEINGFQTGMIILGEKKENPVLLVCGGGPGISEYLMEYMFDSVLPKHFVVCYFDYRGTGLSYDASINPDEMTTETYLSDVDKITDYLRSRFNQEKIYILGHSFGTYIAINAARNHPDKYLAYLAVSQIADQRKSEEMAYDYMVEQYRDRGSRMVEKFEKYDIHNSGDDFKAYNTSGLRDKAMHELGIGTTRDMKSVITGIFFPSLRCRTYTLGERFNFWKGKILSNSFAVTSESFNYNAFENISELKIPVYFFAGEYDYTCCQSLQKEYYDFIKAPKKEYYFYPDAAHSPVFENDEMTSNILADIIKDNSF